MSSSIVKYRLQRGHDGTVSEVLVLLDRETARHFYKQITVNHVLITFQRAVGFILWKNRMKQCSEQLLFIFNDIPFGLIW